MKKGAQTSGPDEETLVCQLECIKITQNESFGMETPKFPRVLDPEDIPPENKREQYWHNHGQLLLFEQKYLPCFIKIKNYILDSESYSQGRKEEVCQFIELRLQIEFSLFGIQSHFGKFYWENFESYTNRLCQKSIQSVNRFLNKECSPDQVRLWKKYSLYVDPIFEHHHIVQTFFMTLSDSNRDNIDTLLDEDEKEADAIWLLVSPIPEKRIKEFQKRMKPMIQEISTFISRLKHLDSFTKEILKHYINLRLKLEYSGYQLENPDYLVIDQFWRGYQNMPFFELIYHEKRLSDTLIDLMEDLFKKTWCFLHRDVLYVDLLDVKSSDFL